MTKLVLKVKGMHCASCSTLIDKLIGKQPGVSAIQTNYGAEKTAIEFDETKITLEKIDELLHKLGYDLIRPDEAALGAAEEEAREARKLREERRRVIASFALSAPIIIYYMAIHMLNLPHVHSVTLAGATIDLNYIYWILSTPIQFVISWPFYRNAWTAVRVGSSNMDVLVVLGTTAAYLYSMFGFLFFNIDHPFWESSAALLSFIILGRYFELVARGRASAAIKELLKLEAKEAHVLRGSEEVTIPIEQIQKGDIVVVRPGEKIPVDGVITEGKTHIDEKVVTGESFPVGKTVGEEVIGATINQEGMVKFKATKVGKETLLNQIIQMVEEAQATRAPIQNLVDKISEYFVPAVVILSIITFVIWYFVFAFPFRTGLLRMIALLVISCPCAMGLATPTALIVGIGRAAKFGVILKGGEALEKAYKISAVAFDKTGTLTIGKPVVTDFIVRGNMTQTEAWRLSAGVEIGSEHPLARAIVEKGKVIAGQLPAVSDFTAVAGLGVQGTVQGKTVLVGNAAFMEERGVAVSGEQSLVQELQGEAKTVVYAAADRTLIAVIAMADTLKPHAKEAIQELKKLGKEIVMITGDNPQTAAAIGRSLGIDRVLAQVLPQEKAAVVKKLQAEGKTVAMVGDGINDSPALAQADVGIAVGSGTDVAVQTGQVILVKDDLRDVVTAIQLSGKTIRKVWQNLFWAFIYNVLAIPVAAGALYPSYAFIHPVFSMLPSGFTLRPEIAGFAMALSSVSVVTNSLLLRRYTPPTERNKKTAS
ncbi:MAG: heavy metal translocating P-type ATPase [bacterium]|nr:heavy metal translocating P-type ATPase [bacterium]MDZ4295937.1 heavy metal translocating P-type ATPase [Patescibacteria group bacterium]